MIAEKQSETLKQKYISYITPIVLRIHNTGELPTLKELLKCQQLGNEYFNYVESFVGTSGLLGAHANGKWVTGFAETCHSILEAYVEHMKFLRAYSNILDNSIIKPNDNAYANMQRMTKEYLQKKQWESLEQVFIANTLPVTGFNYQGANDMTTTPKWQLIAGLIIGTIFAIVILILAVLIPSPTPSQMFIFRGVFAIALAAIAAIIPGLLDVQSRFNKFSIRATGAIAVFVIVWFMNPPALIGN